MISITQKSFLTLSFASFLVIIITCYGIFYYKDYEFSFLILNIFLAWIPFFLSFLITSVYISGLKRSLKIYLLIPVFILWIIFYPNIPYIMTDVIHIRSLDYLKMENNIFVYSQKMIRWYELIEITLSVFLSIVMGFFSLFNIQRLIERHKVLSWAFVIIVSFFSGVGIYFGRFLRLNSWQILSIFSTENFSFVFKRLNFFIEFTIFFTLFWLFIYTVIYLLEKR
ncbi:DUF1361 domain-containing protein [Athalassotoga saccharophila]|uniref:DUF1361 domain-containing protein n=1 Tax=Athalassotoga saccharophila TaxID=1441386 RepID=UPI001E43F338|nr:DUF1361 domain-containing protein [Athalassotoga saccharophila]BBJ27912.1 hypothetical protein ATHSA_0806 [Athalassotoga saccharophila]